MQLPEMMKLRPCDCVPSSSASTMKKVRKKALTDIGENETSQKPFHPPEFLKARSLKMT